MDDPAPKSPQHPDPLQIPEELRMDDAVEPYRELSDSEKRANRTNQAKAWSIAMDPVYGLIGMGLVGFLIDSLADTGKTWTIALSITGLVGGFYLFIKEASKLNREQTNSSRKTDGDPRT